MRKYFSLLFLFTYINSHAQTARLEEDFVSQVLKERIVKYKKNGGLKVFSRLMSPIMEDHLNKIQNNKTLIFQSEKHPKDTLKLKETERTYILNTIRKQYGVAWKENELPGYEILKSDNTRKYLTENNRENTIVIASHPVFIRNNKIAVFYFGNFCYGSNYSVSDLAFYKNANGKWKKWIVISSETN